eukprot:TRINITY_DN3551_c0_g1_i2.p2 TRINITY_DN3551_c0_g1~~TRINITY_DN3551_c0_g1_i2.p2  ORF type:complete len:303 (-),score=54.24 TRINITY_DN3551_c0_g1_i2:1004-1912(-)
MSYGSKWWGDVKGKPVIIAHRCGCGEAPENTVTACRQALKNGASIIQVEVMPAKDGTPIVAQQDDLKRLTGKNLKLSELSVKEIPPLQQQYSSYLPGLLPEFDTTKYSEEEIQIPTLKMLLEAFAEADAHQKSMLFVEPFQYDVKFIALIAQDINQVGIGERIIVGHPRDASVQKKIIELFPDSQILLTSNQCLWMAFQFRMGLLGPEKVPQNRVFNMYYPSEDFSEAIRNYVPFLMWILFSFIGYFSKVLVFQKDFVEFIQKHGCPITAYVVNNEKEWKSLAEMGVKGILTDYPERFKNFL